MKEYFPRDLAKREGVSQIKSKPGREREFQEGLTDFLAEAEILLDLNHPNIVRCYGKLEENQTVYILMEYCEGESLFSWLEASYKANKAPLDESAAVEIMAPVLDALDYIHQKDLLHCDISPKNVHIVKSAQLTIAHRVVLLDFGSAQRIGEGEAQRPVTQTPGFSPPEQEKGQTDLGCWSDVYACAATLYHLTTGKTPPSASKRQRRDTLVPSEKLRTGLSSHFSNALTDALLLDNRRRTQTVKDFRSSLLGPNYPGPAPVGPTRSVGPTVGILDGAAKRANSFFPLALVFCAFLACAIYVARPVRVEPPAPLVTSDSYIVQPADFYILRDASTSPSQALYDDLEGAVTKILRTSDPDLPDRSSYAIFAQGVYSGRTILQPATEGEDIVARAKALIRSGVLPSDFRRTTRFDILFNAVKNAVEGSDEGRKSFVIVISDGVHDETGTETGCLEPSSSLADFNHVRGPLLELLKNTHAELLLVLAGGRPECGEFVVRQWDNLRLSLPAGYRHRLEIIPLAGFAHADQADQATARLVKYWGLHRRTPCITLRPVYHVLTEEQRRSFDAGEDLSVDFFAQSHMASADTNEVVISVGEAHILDSKGRIVEAVDVNRKPEGSPGKGEDALLLRSVSSPGRNGEETVQTLFMRFGKEHKLAPSEKYSILPKTASAQTCAANGKNKVVELVTAEPGQAARALEVLGRRMRSMAGATSALALLFLGWAFWYRRNYDERQRHLFLFRLLFERPFWYWITFFGVTPFALALYIAVRYPGTQHWILLWAVGVLTLILCLVDLKVLWGRLSRTTELTQNGAIGFALQSFILPFVSLALAP